MPELLVQFPIKFATSPTPLDGGLVNLFNPPGLLERPLLEAVTTLEAAASPASVAASEAVDADIDFIPQNAGKLSLRERFYRSHLGRLAMGGFAALGLAAGGVAIDESPAAANSNPVYTVTNHDNDGTHGIYYRNSPSMADSVRSLPYYARYGDRIELICGTNGQAVGEHNNHRWHLAKDLDNPAAPNEFYARWPTANRAPRL